MTVPAQADPGPRFQIKTAAEAFEAYVRDERNRLSQIEPAFDAATFDEASALVLRLLRETTAAEGRPA